MLKHYWLSFIIVTSFGPFVAEKVYAQSAGISDLQQVDTVVQYFEKLPMLSFCTYTFYDIISPNWPAENVIADAFAYPSEMFLQESRYLGGELPRPARLQFTSTLSRKIVIVARGLPGTRASFKVYWECTNLLNGNAISNGWLPAYSFGSTPQGPSTIVSVPSGMPAGTHIGTVEERGGTYDTIMMVLGAGGVPIAYDDDNGVAMMSWLHLQTDCPVNDCSVLVARALNRDSKPGHFPSDGKVKLIWDTDAHNGRDRDGDWLGDGLEVLLGTCDPNDSDRDIDGDGIKDCDDPDVDGDGIQDDLEVMGRGDDPTHESTTESLTKLHYWGADPLVKDLFVEADWMPACLLSSPDCTGEIRNQHQLSATEANRFAARMASVAKVHIDTGAMSSADPTVSGNWGGAELLPDAWANYCTGFSPLREGLFYHVMASDNGQNEGKCSRVNKNDAIFAHETGHYLGLQHWGKDVAGRAGCKPQYASIMNYAYQGQQAFGGTGSVRGPYSSGAYTNIVLNPTKLDESAGIGSSNASGFLGDLTRSVFGRTVNPSGSVDWNMDGIVSPPNTLVQGVLNYAGWTDCDRAPFAMRETVRFVKARFPSVAVNDLGLMMLGPMRDNAGELDGTMYLGMSDLSACDSPGFDNCATFYVSTIVSGLVPAPGLFAAASAGKIVVYADAEGKLYYSRISLRTILGITVVSFSLPRAVGGEAVTGSPIAIKDDLSGRVLVYAPTNNPSGDYMLRRWEYDSISDSWLIYGTEYWNGGSAIVMTNANIGIGLTKGRLSTDPPGQVSIFAVIPAKDAATGYPIMEIARLERTGPFMVQGTPLYSDNWIQLDPGIWTEFNAATAGRHTEYPGRISLAFLPENNEGRFYLGFKGGTIRDDGKFVEVQFIAFTRGNVPWDGSGDVPANALSLMTPTFFANEWGNTIGGLSLTTFNAKIRAAAEFPPARDAADMFQWSSFFPNADGIYNGDQTDFDDVSWVRSHMACALRGDCVD